MRAVRKKRFVLIALALMSAGTTTYADTEDSAFWGKKEYPKVYPFVPMTTKEIYGDVQRISEDKNFLRNFNDIVKKRLSSGRSKEQPWAASYWPLAKGGIADAFEDSKVPYYLDFGRTYLWQWKATASSFEKRVKDVHSKIDQMDEEELARLAPSEKYDLLLGDKNFDLTKRVMKYMKDYGSDNYYGDLTNIVLAPEKGSNNDSVAYAANSMKWNNFKSYDEAFRKDYVLSKRLDTQIALKLVDAGLYNNVVDAMEQAVPQAQKEAKNYVLAQKTQDTIAAWEGICNGWSTAAGLVPRPRNTVSFKLPDGRNLIFYPSDIKGIVSLYWFNSNIQNNAQYDKKGELENGGTILVGNRCNMKNLPKDRYGRLYDPQKDMNDEVITARCAGVHPAKWHLGLVNIMGKQQRSFIVERKVGNAVDNHPMSHYKMNYFNPSNGKSYGDLNQNISRVDEDDQFFEYRSPEAVYVVGVETTMSYINYVKPHRGEVNSEEDDEVIDKTMFYDLELDEHFNIVGGQWRAKKSGIPMGKTRRVGGSMRREAPDYNHNQPDFFWAVSKQWKESKLFDDEKSLAKWKNKAVAPPASWLETAKEKHAFEYNSSLYYGTAKNCKVKNTKTSQVREVFCEHKTNKPQPLSNVVNMLVERSR